MNWISAEAEKIARFMETDNINYKFPVIDSSCNSYFENYGKGEFIVEEFNFSTIPELQKMLQKKEIVHSLSVDMVCAVAAFKNRPDTDAEKREVHTIPTFIYNF